MLKKITKEHLTIPHFRFDVLFKVSFEGRKIKRVAIKLYKLWSWQKQIVFYEKH